MRRTAWLAGVMAIGFNASVGESRHFTGALPTRVSGTFTILHTNDIHGDLREFIVDTGDATPRRATAAVRIRNIRGAGRLVDSHDSRLR